ncbi:hypothetical protein MNB_SUP05-SYMBIONT-4-353 [hydrothermal vent metagenome]|uniref:Uncharacterized protein n=1 Tax=hydrothermal vent metagenome TaxID=652676 RepID=A0A1W1DY11_9ZZZZ
MQLQQTKVSDIINSIKHMSFNDIEKVKNSLVEMDIYFKTHQKDNVKNVVNNFKEYGYDDSFLKDLEQGLKKSSVYEN